MGILDRYVLRSFLFSYLVCFLALTGLYVMIESFHVTGKLIKDSREWTYILVTLPTFAAYKTPLFFYQVAPAVTLMAGMFTVTQMTRANELVPIKAAGVSVYRVFVPLFVLAVISAGIVYFDQELLVAGLRGEIENVDVMIDDGTNNERDRISVSDSMGNRFYITAYWVQQKEIRGIDIMQFFSDIGRVSLAAHADRGFLTLSADGVERWHLSDGTIQSFNRFDPTVSQKTFLEDGLVLIASESERMLDGREYLVSDLSYADIEAAEEVDLELLSTAELIRRSRSGQTSAELLVTIQRRFSWPLSTALLLLVGLPFAVGSENRHVFLALGICLLITFGFFVIETVCRQLGEAGSLSSYLAGWLPTLILGAVGIYLYDRVPT